MIQLHSKGFHDFTLFFLFMTSLGPREDQDRDKHMQLFKELPVNDLQYLEGTSE